MTKVLRAALQEIAELPEAAQEKIGEELLLHLDRCRRLRAKVEKGIQSLGRGHARELDIEDVIKRARREYGR